MTKSQKRKPQRGRPSRRRARSAAARRIRWLMLPIALGLGTFAFYVLVTDGSVGSIARGPAPMDQIDDASRERLEQVLETADRRAGDAP